jgi:hypothetical protein
MSLYVSFLHLHSTSIALAGLSVLLFPFVLSIILKTGRLVF